MNERIDSAVERTLRHADLCNARAVLLLALSGGADSVALLRSLCRLRERIGFALFAAHVEHGLRGASSLKDAAFCETLCRRLNVPLTVDHLSLGLTMSSLGAETAAREARYACLRRRAADCRADTLLTAHHMDDQAETVLQRLLRGSGARGLSGIREISDLPWNDSADPVAPNEHSRPNPLDTAAFADGTSVGECSRTACADASARRKRPTLLLRPLLSLSKQALLDSLGDEPYCTDESNADGCCTRNRLRSELLPLMTRENPQVVSHIAQTARLLAMDEACLSELAQAALSSALTDSAPIFCLRRDALQGLKPAILLRVLRAFAERAFAIVAPNRGELTLSAEDSLSLLELLNRPDGASLNLPHELRAVLGTQALHIVHMSDGAPLRAFAPPEPLPLAPMLADVLSPSDERTAAFLPSLPRCFAFGTLALNLADALPDDPPPDGRQSVVLPKALAAQAVLRFPQPDDHIRPFGAVGGKLLRRRLIDLKLDEPFRAALPLLCVGGDVLWMIGLGASEQTRRTAQPSVRLSANRLPFRLSERDLRPDNHQSKE